MTIRRSSIHSLIIALLLLPQVLTAHASGSCPDNVAAAVAKATGIKHRPREELPIVSAACKVWPNDQKTLLSAFAFATDFEDEKILVVAMVDKNSGRVISSYKRRADEDVILQYGETSLRLDTASYRLARNVRAFGVRFNSAAIGASCPDGMWNDELTLFVRDGETLRPVMHGLKMSIAKARTGCFSGGGGELVYDEAMMSLSVTKTSSHGLADLIVTAQISLQGDGVPENGARNVERRVLRYDGKQYQAGPDEPWWLSFSPPEN